MPERKLNLSPSLNHRYVMDHTEQKLAFLSRHPTQLTVNDPAHMQVCEDIGPLANVLGTVTLPAAFDWRAYNGHSYIGAGRNQGSCGSCYSFGAAATAEGVYNFATGKYDGNCADFSEGYIAWCLSKDPEYSSHFSGWMSRSK